MTIPSGAPCRRAPPTTRPVPVRAALLLAAALLAACGPSPVREWTDLGILYRQTFVGGRYHVQAAQFTGGFEALRDLEFSLRYASGVVQHDGRVLPGGECRRDRLGAGETLRFEKATDVVFDVPPAGCR